MGISNEELVNMASKDLNRLLKAKGIPDSRRREIRKYRRSSRATLTHNNKTNRRQNKKNSCNQKSNDDLRSQIEELKRLGHLQKLRIEEEIKRSFQLKQKLEALEDSDTGNEVVVTGNGTGNKEVI